MAEPIVIRNDNGGKVAEYNARWKQYSASTDQVVIDGSCTSACARFMTLPRVCATPQAYFYLHGITYGTGEVDRAAGVADSKQWESKIAFTIQQKYDAFGFGFEDRVKRKEIHKEPGISIVYFYIPSMDKYQKFLKVKATLFVRPCTSAS
ncbi:MAG: hypothetical protein EOP83_28345 [Verrucomicrobiaceae bacterium]|nr:MAG: hypothetical protein EOP83_28345 [Verrucomicrobiaceae bacterium]